MLKIIPNDHLDLCSMYDINLNQGTFCSIFSVRAKQHVVKVYNMEYIVLLTDHNTVTPVRLEPAAPRSQVKHSSTEPLRSPCKPLM